MPSNLPGHGREDQPATLPHAGRAWRDPEQLEPYLDDALEHVVHGFSMGADAVAGLMGSLFMSADDPLLSAAATKEEAAEAATIRALDRLSPSATGYYAAARRHHAQLDEAPAAVSMLGHALRELDGTFRDVWWELTCFVDDEARRMREDARREPGTRDASHRTQIEFLSRRFDLTPQEHRTWLRSRTLPELAHRGRIGESRGLSADENVFVADVLALFERVVRASEATYGDAVLRAAALLEAGPGGDVTRVLAHHLPHHPPLRRWLLAQIDDPCWMRPLHKAGVLAACEPLHRDGSGSPVAPMSPGARATARVASALRDDDLLRELVPAWLAVDNPRLHTDVVQILVEARNPLYEIHVETLCSWLVATREHRSFTRLVGDAGTLRFPSHCLRLAARSLADGRVDIARRLGEATARALALQARDERRYVELAELAILGADAVLDEAASRFLIDVLETELHECKP